MIIEDLSKGNYYNLRNDRFPLGIGCDNNGINSYGLIIKPLPDFD